MALSCASDSLYGTKQLQKWVCSYGIHFLLGFADWFLFFVCVQKDDV